MTPSPEVANSIGDFFSSWSFSGPQFIVVAFLSLTYLVGMLRLQIRSGWQAIPIRKMLYAIGGYAILFFAVAGPPEAFSDDMFFAHMTQHILIAMVASVLLLAASPMAAYLWAMPETVRAGLAPSLAETGWLRRITATFTSPKFALPAFVLTLWGWHVPEAYALAIDNNYAHLAMHLSMFTTSLLFWWPIIGPPPVRFQLTDPQRIIYLILVVTPTAVLAAIITLSNAVIYTSYIDTPHHFTLTPNEDQRIGGLLMWIPGNIIYLATLTTLFLRWFAQEDRKNRRYRLTRRQIEATRRRIQELEENDKN